MQGTITLKLIITTWLRVSLMFFSEVRVQAPGPKTLDELTFDLSLTLLKGKYSGKVRSRSKVSFMAPRPDRRAKKVFVIWLARFFTNVLSLSFKFETCIFGSKWSSCLVFFFRIDEWDDWLLWDVVLNFLTLFD